MATRMRYYKKNGKIWRIMEGSGREWNIERLEKGEDGMERGQKDNGWSGKKMERKVYQMEKGECAGRT
jgi:hypothetical protein